MKNPLMIISSRYGVSIVILTILNINLFCFKYLFQITPLPLTKITLFQKINNACFYYIWLKMYSTVGFQILWWPSCMYYFVKGWQHFFNTDIRIPPPHTHTPQSPPIKCHQNWESTSHTSDYDQYLSHFVVVHWPKN